MGFVRLLFLLFFLLFYFDVCEAEEACSIINAEYRSNTDVYKDLEISVAFFYGDHRVYAKIWNSKFPNELYLFYTFVLQLQEGSFTPINGTM